MTAYEEMVKFEIGMEMGLLSMEDLRVFLSEKLRETEVPYIYTAAYLSLDKGQEAVVDTIFYNLQGNHTVDRSAGNTVQRALIGVIRDRFQSGGMTLAQCVECLHRLTDYAEADWDLLTIDEYYRLNQSGYSSDEEFNAMLGGIFDRAI